MKTQILTLLLLVAFSTCFATIKSSAFITTWKTEIDNDDITIYVNPEFKTAYKYHIDWGDGYKEKNLTTNAMHRYAKAGVYIVKITGDFPAIYSEAKYFKNAAKLQSIENWGAIKWQSMEKAFYGCTNLVYNATDTPNLKKVTDMREMFVGARKFNGDISKWNVKNVIRMDHMFSSASSFNQDIGGWDVSNVWSMINMFSRAASFNQDIGDWDVSKVRSMGEMFAYNTVFNQDISNWDVSNVIDMFSMFKNAEEFNQDLSDWETHNVTECKNFNTNSGLSLEKFPKAGNCFNKI